MASDTVVCGTGSYVEFFALRLEDCLLCLLVCLFQCALQYHRIALPVADDDLDRLGSWTWFRGRFFRRRRHIRLKHDSGSLSCGFIRTVL